MTLKHLSLLFSIFITTHTFSQLVWHHTDGPEGALNAFITSTDSLAFVSTEDFLFTLQKEDSVWTKTPYDGPEKWVIHNNFFAGLQFTQRADTFVRHLMTSEDLGKTWSSVDITNSIPQSNVIAVVDSGIFILDILDYYMYNSKDKGVTWDSVRLPVSFWQSLQAFDNKLYLNNEEELWVSDSTGLNWRNISPSMKCTRNLQVQDSFLLSVGDNRICRSSDYGKTWSSTATNSFFTHHLQIVDTLVYSSGADLYRSRDFGITWDLLASEIELPDIHKMTEFNDELYISSLEQGIFRWNDSLDSQNSTVGLSNFMESNSGIGKAQIHEMASTTNRVYTATTNGLFSYNIANDEWHEIFHLIGDFSKKSIDCNDNGWVVYSPDDREFFLLSEDHAQTWDTIYMEDVYQYSEVEEVRLIGNTIFYFSHFFGQYSTDKGLTWNRLQISPMDLSFTHFNNVTYASSFAQLYHTTDDGLNWEFKDLDFDIDQLMSTEDYLFILSRFYSRPAALYVSIDGAWKDITQNLPESTATFPTKERFFVSKGDSSYYLFWGEHGVFESKDTFQSWNLVLPGFHGEHFLIQDSMIFMGDNGMYRSNINELISSLNTIQSSSSIKHLDIYPNPNSGNLAIRVNQDISTQGMMSIYASDGSLVKTQWLKNISKDNPIQVELVEKGVFYISIHSNKTRWLGKTVIIQ